jgi:hypothetical protein
MNASMFLQLATAAALCCSLASADEPAAAQARQRLQALMPSRAQVELFLRGKQGPEQLSRNNGWLFDADLGWVLCDSIRADGVHSSKTFYHYEPDGARKVVNFPERTCRIHTYGDSFTHCDQVSDGETWQEYLAAHLQEPIRNYGVGGYSVYQAYRRMLKVEAQHPARYIILNIYDDDHYRNLDTLRSIRFGRRIPDGFTLPHLRVDVARNRCEPVENLLHKPEDVYRLSDEEFVYQTFKDDPVLRLVLAGSDKNALTPAQLDAIAAAFGIPREQLTDTEPARRIDKIHTTAALFATKHVIRWTEEYTAKNDKKLLLILSFGRRNMLAALEGKPRFDQELLDWLKDKPYPVLDMRDAFRREFAQFKGDAQAFLGRYYNGHHSPAGNFFTAWALRDTLVRWLDPAPLPYRRSD